MRQRSAPGALGGGSAGGALPPRPPGPAPGSAPARPLGDGLVLDLTGVGGGVGGGGRPTPRPSPRVGSTGTDRIVESLKIWPELVRSMHGIDSCDAKLARTRDAWPTVSVLIRPFTP